MFTGIIEETGNVLSFAEGAQSWRLEIEAFGSAEAKRRQQSDAAELIRLRKENKRKRRPRPIDFRLAVGGAVKSWRI